jgi:superfamily II DNA or RNA helicase
MSKIPKNATCIRNTSSWGDLKAEYKFDSASFNAKKIIEKLSILSPKMNVLLKKIKELDEEDLKKTGKLNKHIIYSDVAGTYGAKMVASVLIADGFKLIYNNGFKLKDNKELEKNKTFGLLTTSTVYKKPLTVGLKKNILSTMNKRPENVFGENMRIIVLDSGFKEGIDVFDVKYIHLLEPLITKAEQTQVIGRGTRYCGQAGLPFIPSKGWLLYIFRYNMMYNQDTNLHELYLKHSNSNISSLNFVADIEDLLITSAVDIPLTENIHNLDTKNNRFYNMVKELKRLTEVKKPPPPRADRIVLVNNIRGKVYTNDKMIDCRVNCKGELEQAPRGLIIAAAIHVGKKELIKELYVKNCKPLLCRYISKMPEFCKAINSLWSQPIKFLKIYKKSILRNLDVYRRTYSLIHESNYDAAVEFMNMFNEPEEPKYIAEPPKNKLSYLELSNYIEKHYKPYKWNAIEIKNKCIIDDDKKDEVENSIVEYTNTQKFIKDYLTPASPYKGAFLYHSVGSGKTCSAIATATQSFEKEGYTILWVTRHTLKEDIWKNMFDKICNVIIQEKVKKGYKIPSGRAERMNLLGNNWMQPISYKQFTNMIKGKNKFYEEIVKRNGKQDPFRKTLIVIDEIHKIYSSSLSAIEKPNPEVLQSMIQNSYDKSGKDSLKLLLMSATPITDDPMSVIKILNLMIEKQEQFPENFEIFKRDYCLDTGLFTDEGYIKFLNKVAGLVSYIDRSSDLSQFAYPVINDIMVKVDIDEKSNIELKELENKLMELEEKLKNTDLSTKQGKQEKKLLTTEIKQITKQIKKMQKSDKEPTNVIDYVNTCFTKKYSVKEPSEKKVKDPSVPKEPKEPKALKIPKEPKGLKAPKEKVEKVPKEKVEKVPKEKVVKVPKEKAVKVPKEKPVKICPEGKFLNVKTNRCNKIK